MTRVFGGLRRLAELITRPVEAAPRFFVAMLLLACIPTLTYSLVLKARILHFIMVAVCEGSAAAYCCCLIVANISRRGLRNVIIAVCLTLSTLWAVIEVGCLTTTGTLVSDDAIALMAETNADEAAGFFVQYFNLKSAAIMAGLAAAAVIIVLVTAFILKSLCRSRAGISVVALLLAVTVSTGAVCSIRMLRGAFIKDYCDYLEWISGGPENPDLVRANELCFSAPLVKIPCLINGYGLVNKNYDRWLSVQRDAMEMHVARCDSAQFDVVVVVGESFIRKHSQLYGYYLPTNPGLKAESDSGRLIVYDSVMSTANFTTPSLRNMFNLNDAAKGEEWYEGVYFPLVMKKAGFNVYHYDNQTVGVNSDRGISRMFYSPLIADTVYAATSDSLFDYDGDFLNYVHSTYAQAEVSDPKLVIYHLKGQHFPASARYKGAKHFTAADITVRRPWLNDERRAEIAEYDNATVYNDSIVCAIASRFQQRPAVMLYFSDHGEDCWDLAPVEARNKQMPNDPQWVDRQFHVPFFVWLSPEFIERYPLRAKELRDAASEPMSLGDLGRMILGMCEVTYDKKGRSE